MTKYAFITFQLFLFCFISFEFSSVASARACSTLCDNWDKGCWVCPTQTRALKRPQPKQTSNSSYSCKEPADVATQCAGRGWNLMECRCKSQAEAGGSTPPSTDDGSANSAMADAINKCRTSVDEAFNACDQDQDTGMQGAQSALTKFSTQAGQMGMGACTKLAPLMAGANAATIYFSQNCSSSRSACMQTCTKARTDMQQGVIANFLALNQSIADANRRLVDDMYDQCKKLDSKLAEAQQAIQNTVATVQGASSCNADTNTDMKSYCETNPTALGCETVATDCSNPTVAASNQICICKANPNASGCISALAKASDMNGGGSADMSSSSLKNGTTAGGGLDSDNMFGGTGWAGNGMTPSKDGADSVGGKKGAGANLGDGGSGAPGAGGGDGKGGAAAQALQVNAGFRGGGGGGGWGSGSGSGGSGGGYGGAYDPKDPQMKAGGPNLRDFLPNGKMDPRSANRGLAGVSGPDGITGPHSDIWKKIQNRYQVQIEGSKLMP